MRVLRVAAVEGAEFLLVTLDVVEAMLLRAENVDGGNRVNVIVDCCWCCCCCACASEVLVLGDASIVGDRPSVSAACNAIIV